MRKIYLMAGILLFLLTACEKNLKPFEVLEEKPGKGNTSGIKVNFHSRDGLYPGFEVTSYIQGLDSSMGPYYLKTSVVDAAGNTMNYDFGPQPKPVVIPEDGHVLWDKLTPDSATLAKEARPYLKKRPLVWYTGGLSPSRLNVIIPYPLVSKAVTGTAMEVYIKVEGFFGEIENWNPTEPYAPPKEPKPAKPDLFTRMIARYPQPELREAEIKVGKLEISDASSRPRSWDFTLSGDGNVGYPDLMWEVDADGFVVWQTPYHYKNGMVGDFTGTSCRFWLAGAEPKVTVCFMDWDNETVFNNQHDEIGCWEGAPSDLSSNPLKPTVLKFGDIKWAEVSLK